MPTLSREIQIKVILCLLNCVSMVGVIIGLSLLFLLLAMILNFENAPHILSGYHSQAATERSEEELRKFIPFFRRFHLTLSLTLGCIGIGLYYLVGSNAAGMFLGVYPLLAYIYFLWRWRKSYFARKGKTLRIGIGILATMLLLVSTMLYRSMQPNDVTFTESEIHITGSYGLSVEYAQIAAVEIVEELPPIRRKRHGYNMGHIMKGEFRTQDHQNIKIIADTHYKPFVLIKLNNGRHIYLSTASSSAFEIRKELQVHFDFTEI